MRHICTPEASHVEIAGPAQTATKIGATSDTKSVRDVLLLASNSYLDLCNEPELKQAAAEAVLKWGTGSGGARLTTGNKTPHEDLETALVRFKGEEAAITFATGYMANVGTISALASKQIRDASTNGGEPVVSECIVFSDELNHASIIDGIRLSKAKCYVYRHNDMADLQRVIEAVHAEHSTKNESSEQFTTTRHLIVTDAVFSMDGDLANLPELQKIAKANNCLLMIDEAHSTGVLGKTGRGLAEHFNNRGIPCEHADVTVGTLSKSVGCEGGFVVGSRQLIEFLKNKARSFIFTTAMSPAMAQAACNNLKFIEQHPERVQQLQDNVKFFCDALVKAGAVSSISQLDTCESAIVPIIIGDEAKALAASAALQERGILIPAIRYPTVAKGQARLRASIMATHTHEDLQKAANAIAEVLKGK
ncbi:MAG: 8-amino-7-oxononanoate synthase [Fibrobacter sp.]|nr:8-amino-7-oxononanoate synthase [Fibrobacter sp.]